MSGISTTYCSLVVSTLILITTIKVVIADSTSDPPWNDDLSPLWHEQVVRVLVFLQHDLGNLSCFMNPHALVENLDWYFNGRQISQGHFVTSGRYYTQRSGLNGFSLYIYPLGLNDSGRYVCVDHESGEVTDYQVFIIILAGAHKFPTVWIFFAIYCSILVK